MGDYNPAGDVHDKLINEGGKELFGEVHLRRCTKALLKSASKGGKNCFFYLKALPKGKVFVKASEKKITWNLSLYSHYTAFLDSDWSPGLDEFLNFLLRRLWEV